MPENNLDQLIQKCQKLIPRKYQWGTKCQKSDLVTLLTLNADLALDPISGVFRELSLRRTKIYEKPAISTA